MTKGAAGKGGKKLTVKKESVKDLKVKSAGSVMGGGGKLSQPRTPCDPGCHPCG